MPTSLTVLLPPSEGKAAGGRGRFAFGSGAFKRLGPRRRAVADAARLAVEGNPALPASARYSGVVWKHLGPDTLRATARTRASDAIVVVSGLMGLAAFDDPVPEYRAKMSLSAPPLGKLSRWWRPVLTETLADRVSGGIVLDLLPNEHADAIERAVLASAAKQYLRVEFTKRGGGASGHNAKAVKGLVARAALETATRTLVPTLESFATSGTTVGDWSWAASSESDGVVTVEIRNA